jgi:hypothetical protein
MAHLALTATALIALAFHAPFWPLTSCSQAASTTTR